MVVLVVGGLPVWEDYQRVVMQNREVQEEILSVSRQSDLLPKLREEAARQEQHAAEQLGIDLSRLPDFRQKIQQLIRTAGCRLVVATEGKAHKQGWSPEMNPLEKTTSVGKEKPKFEIASTSTGFTVEGQLQQLDQLISELRRVHDFAILSKLSLQKPSQGEELRLDFEMTLFQIIQSSR